MNTLFNKLLDISLPTQYICNDSNQQIEVNYKWKDIFDIIKSKHWHNDGKLTCPHAESLYDHLLLCAELTYQKAESFGYSEHDCIKAYFSGLLHDLGKPGTQKVMGKYLSFKGHAIVGGALIENFWNPEIEIIFGLTREDWGDISFIADVHMCTYFPDQTSDTHHFCSQILPYNVKKMLVHNQTCRFVCN